MKLENVNYGNLGLGVFIFKKSAILFQGTEKELEKIESFETTDTHYFRGTEDDLIVIVRREAIRKIKSGLGDIRQLRDETVMLKLDEMVSDEDIIMFSLNY